MKRILSTSLLACCLFCLTGCGEKTKEEMPWGDELSGGGDAVSLVGKTMPAWSEGYLDIHYISTNRGECALYIFPDGTTLVADAGEIHSGDEHPQRPNEESRVYEIYARYIKHFLPASSDGKIDYAFLTHFHIDHMGETHSSNPVHPEGGYQLCGFSGLYEEVPFRKLIDRGYPTYDDDPTIFPPCSESKATPNFIKFVKYAVGHKGLVAERYNLGTDQQIVLTGANKDKYTNFRVFNHVGNAKCYQKGSDGTGVIKGSEAGSENGQCCGFHVQYGKFDFIAAGDLVSTPQNMQALYCRDYIEKLEGFKSNHHMNTNSWGTGMKNYAFNPRVIIIPSFNVVHADPGILSYLFQQVWVKDIYLTKNWDSTMEANKDVYAQCAGYDGHVVLRVDPGGEQFRVYMLDNRDELYKIKSVSRVYACK